MTRFFVGLTVVLTAVVCTFAVRVFPNGEHPPHREPAKARVAIAPPSLAAVGGDSTAAVEQQVRDFVQGVLDERERVAEAERLEAARRTPVVSVAGAGTQSGCGADWDCYRECSIDHESRTAGEYGAVSPGGTYRGAFQFLASTWRSVAVNAGLGEWADVPVDEVPAWVQDAVARFLWEHSGTSPWGGRC